MILSIEVGICILCTQPDEGGLSPKRWLHHSQIGPVPEPEHKLKSCALEGSAGSEMYGPYIEENCPHQSVSIYDVLGQASRGFPDMMDSFNPVAKSNHSIVFHPTPTNEMMS